MNEKIYNAIYDFIKKIFTENQKPGIEFKIEPEHSNDRLGDEYFGIILSKNPTTGPDKAYISGTIVRDFGFMLSSYQPKIDQKDSKIELSSYLDDIVDKIKKADKQTLKNQLPNGAEFGTFISESKSRRTFVNDNCIGYGLDLNFNIKIKG